MLDTENGDLGMVVVFGVRPVRDLMFGCRWGARSTPKVAVEPDSVLPGGAQIDDI